MGKKILATAGVILFVNILPYACRLYRGLDWAAQELPDSGYLIVGLLFFHAFASVPAFPMILALWLGRRLRWAFIASFLAATAGLVYFHHDYDLASDAQAAIGLIFIPIYVTIVLEAPAFLTGLVAQRLYDKITRGNQQLPPPSSLTG